uniref:N-acetyltransferase domain-containing protein n=1 Tax=Steinernema glaseri TaxID=37863 RepID=A0A1I7Y4Y1_9BILA
MALQFQVAMPVTIRDATADDAPIINQFTRDLAEHCGSPNGPETSVETLRSFMANNTIRAFLAILEDKIVGYLAYYTAYSTWKGPFVMMEDLYVDANVRGQKIGARLLAHLAQWAKANNFKRIKFECSEGDEKTMQFYKKFSATPVDHLHFSEYQIKGDALDALAHTTFNGLK